MPVAFLVVVVGILVCIVGMEYAKKLTFARINYLYANRRPDELILYLDRPLVKRLYPKYNQLYMTFNADLLKGDAREASRVLDALLAMKTEQNQREDLVVKAFGFYMDAGEYDRAKALMEEIRGLSDAELAMECAQMFEILAEKSTAYIEEMTERLTSLEKDDKVQTCLLLAAQYDNLGDNKAAERYRRMVAGLLAGKDAE